MDVVADALPFIWGKLMVNASINSLTALLRVRNGEIVEIPSARILMGELVGTASVADALGVVLPFSIPQDAVEEVANRTQG